MRGFLDMKLGFFDCQTWKSGEWRELTNYGSQYSSQLGASWSCEPNFPTTENRKRRSGIGDLIAGAHVFLIADGF